MTDWSPVIIGIVAALPPTILAVATLIQGIRTHATFNSKMDKMLKLATDGAFAEGVKQEKDAQAVIEAAVVSASKKVQENLNQPNGPS